MSGTQTLAVTDYETLSVGIVPAVDLRERRHGHGHGHPQQHGHRLGPHGVLGQQRPARQPRCRPRVTIPANQASATFTVTAVDDALLDGTQVGDDHRLGDGYVDGARHGQRDGRRRTLALLVAVSPASISENGGTATATVTRSNTDLAAALTGESEPAATPARRPSRPRSPSPPTRPRPRSPSRPWTTRCWTGRRRSIVSATAAGLRAGVGRWSVTDYETLTRDHHARLDQSENGGTATAHA